MSQLEGDPDLLVECRYVVSTNPPQLGMSAERGYVRVRQRAGYEAIPKARRGDGVGALAPIRRDVAGGGGTSRFADGILDDETYDWAAERSKQSRSPRVLGHSLSVGRGKSDPSSRATELPELMERDVLAPSIRGGLELLRTREDLARHVAAAAAAQSELPPREVIDLLIHQTTDPEVVVAEFTYRWHHQEPLSVGCVFVVRVRDGKIVESLATTSIP